MVTFKNIYFTATPDTLVQESQAATQRYKQVRKKKSEKAQS